MPHNRLLGFAIKQALERRLDATYRRLSSRRQSLPSVTLQLHMMTSNSAYGRHHHLASEWPACTGAHIRYRPATFTHDPTNRDQDDIDYSTALPRENTCNTS